MLRFTQLLTPATIRQGISCSSKKRVFETLAQLIRQHLHDDSGISNCEEHACIEQHIFDSLLSREKLGNSALGNGIAMPKARCAKNSQPIAAFIKLQNPIDFDSSDRRNVDLIFALIIPENCGNNYSHALSRLADKLLDKSIAKKLRAAQNEEEIWHIFHQLDECLMLEPPLQIEQSFVSANSGVL